MTRTTPGWHPLSNFHATPTGGRLTTTYVGGNRPHAADLPVESGLEPGPPPGPGSRDLTTRATAALLAVKVTKHINVLSAWPMA
ncbi:hypothetical protein AVEN_215205-1 [Araneus ventricosus]|uniref:Uncharacterized protein n=1 Tax=Araneus ventricosus TaxID=182803 RepID=A0A4Y2SK45_ARAVE|nr:hypothetical protein AVEN_215205-1 [Araneus ventricosus]